VTGIDWLIVGVVAVSVLLAASQGFFFEMFSLAGVVVGYVVAAWEYPRVAAWFNPYVKSAWMADIAGFVAIFLGVVLLAGIAGRMARWSMKEIGLRWFDRVLGGAFGLLRGLLVVTVLVLAVASFAPESKLLAGSRFAPYLLVVARGATWVAPSQVRQQFRIGVQALRDRRAAGEAGNARAK
jgi:membrane protein required for colicin V production